MPQNIEQHLIECLHSKGKKYLPLKEVAIALPLSIRKKLKINAGTSVNKLLKIFEEHLGQGLKIFKKSRSIWGLTTLRPISS